MTRRTERSQLPPPGEGSRGGFMIAGELVILRALEAADLERCYRWMNDPNIVRTLKSRYPMAFDHEALWLDNAVRGSHTARHFAIENKQTRDHIGNASVHDIDWVSRNAQFGLFIGEPAAWNKGFGSDVVKTLVHFAFTEMNLLKLKIYVFDYNERARHLLLGQGFVQEGKLQREFFREGTFHDLLILSIFRSGTDGHV